MKMFELNMTGGDNRQGDGLQLWWINVVMVFGEDGAGTTESDWNKMDAG